MFMTKQKNITFNFDNRPKRFVDVETGETVDLYPDTFKTIMKKLYSIILKI